MNEKSEYLKIEYDGVMYNIHLKDKNFPGAYFIVIEPI